PVVKTAGAHDGSSVASVKSKMARLPRQNHAKLRRNCYAVDLAQREVASAQLLRIRHELTPLPAPRRQALCCAILLTQLQCHCDTCLKVATIALNDSTSSLLFYWQAGSRRSSPFGFPTPSSRKCSKRGFCAIARRSWN